MAGYRSSQIQSLLLDLTTDPLSVIAEQMYDLQIERDQALEKIDELKREIGALEIQVDELSEKVDPS